MEIGGKAGKEEKVTPLPGTLRPDPASSGGSITTGIQPGAGGEVCPLHKRCTQVLTPRTPRTVTGWCGKGSKPNTKNGPGEWKSEVQGQQESFLHLPATQPGPNHDLGASVALICEKCTVTTLTHQLGKPTQSNINEVLNACHRLQAKPSCYQS